MILPIVLVGLLVVALIGTAMTRTVLLQRRAMRQAGYEQQAAWLADSAMQRARARLAGDAEYQGETWTVASEELAAGAHGIAVIRIVTADGAKRIAIEATYPEQRKLRTLQRREQHVKLTSPGGSS